MKYTVKNVGGEEGCRVIDGLGRARGTRGLSVLLLRHAEFTPRLLYDVFPPRCGVSNKARKGLIHPSIPWAWQVINCLVGLVGNYVCVVPYVKQSECIVVCR